MEQQPKNKLLQICGILMIIGGCVAFILGIIALLATLAVFALAGSQGILLLLSVIMVLVAAVVEFIAGLAGVKNADKPENAGKCINLGFAVIVFSLLGNIVLPLISGGTLSPLNIVLGLLLPALYLVGAYQNKGKIS